MVFADISRYHDSFDCVSIVTGRSTHSSSAFPYLGSAHRVFIPHELKSNQINFIYTPQFFENDSGVFTVQKIN